LAILNGEKAIAEYIKVSEQTVAKYIKFYGLPVRRMGKSKYAGIMTTTTLIEKWIENHINIVDLPNR